MKLESYNNLLELFFDRYQLENKNEIFLQSLKNENSNFTWKQTFDAIQNLSLFLDQYITTNDRCLLISENRPEWLISDLSIMLSKGITVPAYTTYVERDYEFLINDCKPSVIIASDAIQLKKINNIIKKYSFIKKVISFENIKDKNVTFIEEIFKKTYKQEKNFKEIRTKQKRYFMYNLYIWYSRKSQRCDVKSWRYFK
jgi:long-chain acyl-CoA synthetase